MELEHYLEHWELSCPEEIARTATSSVYRVSRRGEPVVLKLLTDIGRADEQKGAIALQCFDGRSSVRLLRHDENAHLLEHVDGGKLSVLVSDHEDEQATFIISDILEELHRASDICSPDTSGLIPLAERFNSLLEYSADLGEKRNKMVSDAATIARELLSEPSIERVLHGDLHHGNILMSSSRGWLAIDPKGLYGDRVYDAANALINPIESKDIVQSELTMLKRANIICARLGCQRSRLLAFVFCHACLSACWSLEAGDDPEHALVMAEIAKSLLAL